MVRSWEDDTGAEKEERKKKEGTGKGAKKEDKGPGSDEHKFQHSFSPKPK